MVASVSVKVYLCISLKHCAYYAVPITCVFNLFSITFAYHLFSISCENNFVSILCAYNLFSITCAYKVCSRNAQRTCYHQCCYCLYTFIDFVHSTKVVCSLSLSRRVIFKTYDVLAFVSYLLYISMQILVLSCTCNYYQIYVSLRLLLIHVCLCECISLLIHLILIQILSSEHATERVLT